MVLFSFMSKYFEKVLVDNTEATILLLVDSYSIYII